VSRRNRHRRGPTRPLRGTGAPDPAKDRTVHEQARGVKRMTLDDLTDELPSEEELTNYPRLLANESDRSAAIMASALVEQILYTCLSAHLADPENGEQREWFFGHAAPFRTFDAKIKLGQALAVYDEGLVARLTIIRKVRNVFAHRSLPLDFTHEALRPLCLELTPNPERDAQKPMRVIFATYCLAVGRVLIEDAFKCGGKKLPICIPTPRD